MVDKVKLTQKMKLVDMYKADISTDNSPIIGTQALATCVGVLVYCPQARKAIVAHAATESYPIFKQIMNLIFDNGLENLTFKYLIIRGYYYNHYNVYEDLDSAFRSLSPMFEPFLETELSQDAVMKDPELPAYQFAFDSISGTFVSDKVLYGIDYNNVHNSEDIPKR